MKRFAFPLDSVLRYRRSRRDLCRQVVARVLAEDRGLFARVQGISDERETQLDELRAQAASGRMNIDGSMARRFHAARLQGELRVIERERELLTRQLEMARGLLVQADRDVKLLERLRDQRESAHRAEQEKRALHEMEESWMALHAGEFGR